MTINRNKAKFAILIFWVVALIGAFYGYLNAGLTFNELVELIQKIVQRSGIWAPAVYVLFYSFRSLVFFPASLLTIISGMVFGPWFGLLYTLIGENISANISFVVGRYLMSDLEGYIHNKNQIFSRIIEHIQGNGFLAVLFMRLTYLPFDLVGYSSGIFKLNQKDFALGTLLGTIPGLMAYTFLGSSFINLDFLLFGSSILLASLLGAMLLKTYIMRNAPHKSKTEVLKTVNEA
ncbi:MAG: TVP38/TMEM64 family protein [Desulfobulbaceae bacterium]|nr:TVP38/TMEM64 family protein [Desulfobulbaceae bacterium]